MRTCLTCGAPESVKSDRGIATCPFCKRAKYLIVKRRYRKSAKGQRATRAYEELPNTRERRRRAAASPQGQKNKRKYEATEKGKATRLRLRTKYEATERYKRKAAERHLATKDLPRRAEQRKLANARYAASEKMAAKKRRDYARRKAAIVPERPFTAGMWIEMVERHRGRCYYCKKRRVLTLDHVLPLTKGGLHVEQNIVPACKSCNSRKNNRLVLLI